MKDKPEKLLFEKNNLSKDEKRAVSFWISNLRSEDDISNTLSIVDCIKKEGAGLYVIGSSLQGTNYKFLEFVSIDPECTKIASMFPNPDIVSFGDDLLRYAIGAYSPPFTVRPRGTTIEYAGYKLCTLIALSKDKGMPINIITPIKYESKFYSNWREFESSSEPKGLVLYRSK